MANSHSSKFFHLPCKVFCLFLLLGLLLSGSCSAIRTGATLRMLNEDVSGQTELRYRKHKMGFPYKSLVFNFFPKGSPVPPSGPSKRHNSVQN
ncbi:hypothetical protein L6164_001801 [Bauhinia variegata]|uniref:Uncharacterized protein n=1 Tax=Bauhinia variegata TaxID=167791 RepID=A0ACB9QAR6_BAUVA|nr:hypothetical protein L6164_001801 [Bauhinia variegata]